MIELTLPVAKLWLSMAAITFAIICYSDLRERKIDLRRNSVMTGAGLMATIPLGLGFIYIIHIGIVVVFNKVFETLNKRKGVKYFAKGDQSILFWVLPGLIVLGMSAPWVFMLILVIVLIGISVIQARFNKPFGNLIPGAVIMAVAFIITLGIFI
jgi:hypothetical protein